MGSHPINLAFRFLLELSALASIGVWGWRQSETWHKYILAFLLPLLLMAIWGVFAVPDDPSRSGSAPIVTNGVVRLAIEFGIFSFATWSLFNLGYTKMSLALGLLVLLHYILSYDRILWLVSQ